MTTNTKLELEFLSQVPLSLRAVDQAWVNERAAQIPNEAFPGEPNVEAALAEVVERLHQRLGQNVKEDTPGFVYTPDNDTDPYVVCVPLDKLSRGQRLERNRIHREPDNTPSRLTDTSESNLRKEFENLLFQDLLLEEKVLEQDHLGRYITPWVNARWEGFQMYHRHLTVAGKPAFKNRYNRTLGRYVIGKIGHQGKAIFTTAPFRHQTKAEAMQEANRLAVELGEPFAVFRCLDIIDLT